MKNSIQCEIISNNFDNLKNMQYWPWRPAMGYEIDSLDRQILRRLLADSRTPFLEIARDLGVSGGTIHARFKRMREAGLIRGSRILLDNERLGLRVTAYIGIKLVRASSCANLQDRLRTMPEIVEVHYTTGTYALFAKVVVASMQDLHRLLLERLQGESDEIQSTETFVVLNTAVDREAAV
jgi:Lrp/AsnC family transcriptional regulator for asnA, asnC and gidA